MTPICFSRGRGRRWAGRVRVVLALALCACGPALILVCRTVWEQATRTIVHHTTLPELDARAFHALDLGGTAWLHFEGAPACPPRVCAECVMRMCACAHDTISRRSFLNTPTYKCLRAQIYIAS